VAYFSSAARMSAKYQNKNMTNESGKQPALTHIQSWSANTAGNKDPIEHANKMMAQSLMPRADCSNRRRFVKLD